MSSKGSEKVKHIAIFASGAGSNALKIIQHFEQHTQINISLIVSNKTDAGVLTIAHQHHIPTLVLEKDKFYKNAYINEFQQKDIDFIVLAGFLWKIPSLLIAAYPNKIINIHPALLPGYGGKGMYGHFVHEAVIAAKEKQSGITIHYVDEKYDHGSTIFQTTCDIEENDTPETLAQKIHVLEHQHFPVIIEKILTN
jgi:phosphoribosylglycinamide formyltransferase-1